MNGIRLVNGVKIEQGVDFKPYLGKIWMAKGSKSAGEAAPFLPKGGHLPPPKKDIGVIVPKSKKEFNKWTTEVIGWYTENWKHGPYVGSGAMSSSRATCNCIVKINYVKPNQKFEKGYATNSRYSQWFKPGQINAANYVQASMRYIARDAATFKDTFFEDVIGENGVSMYRYNNKELEFFDVDDVAEIFGCQQVFNVELSPDPNVELDLFLFTKLVMEEFQKIVGKKIKWFAGNHFNTDNPHVHVKFGSVDGKDLFINGDKYMKSGKLREICRDITTKMYLGKGLEKQRAEMEEAVYSPYQNSLDVELFRLLDDNNNVSSFKLRKSKNYRAILARLRDREKQGYCQREKDEKGRSYWHVHRIYSKDLQKRKIADVLGIKNHKSYILDENPEAVYEGEVLLCKRPNDDSNTVYMALRDTDGRKHLRMAFVKEQDKDFIKGEEFDLERFKQMSLQRMERC